MASLYERLGYFVTMPFYEHLCCLHDASRLGNQNWLDGFKFPTSIMRSLLHGYIVQATNFDFNTTLNPASFLFDGNESPRRITLNSEGNRKKSTFISKRSRQFQDISEIESMKSHNLLRPDGTWHLKKKSTKHFFCS